MPEPAKYVPGSLPTTIKDAHYELIVGKEVLRAKQAELRANEVGIKKFYKGVDF